MTVAPARPQMPATPKTRAPPPQPPPGLPLELSEPFPYCGEWFAGRKAKPGVPRGESQSRSAEEVGVCNVYMDCELG
jgi:hypothetical protein